MPDFVESGPSSRSEPPVSYIVFFVPWLISLYVHAFPFRPDHPCPGVVPLSLMSFPVVSFFRMFWWSSVPIRAQVPWGTGWVPGSSCREVRGSTSQDGERSTSFLTSDPSQHPLPPNPERSRLLPSVCIYLFFPFIHLIPPLVGHCGFAQGVRGAKDKFRAPEQTHNGQPRTGSLPAGRHWQG